MVCGALLPVDAVVHGLQPDLLVQTPERLLLDILHRQPGCGKQQPVVLQDAPVGQPVEGRVGLKQVVDMGGEEGVDVFHDVVRQRLRILEDLDAPDVVLDPYPALQCAPGPLSRGLVDRRVVEEVLEQPDPGVAVLLVPRERVGPGQVHQEGVPAEGEAPLLVAEGDVVPVYRAVEVHRPRAALHLVAVGEDEGVVDCLVRDIQQLPCPLGILRAVADVRKRIVQVDSLSHVFIMTEGPGMYTPGTFCSGRERLSP